jgi:hypothetical protein
MKWVTAWAMLTAVLAAGAVPARPSAGESPPTPLQPSRQTLYSCGSDYDFLTGVQQVHGTDAVFLDDSERAYMWSGVSGHETQFVRGSFEGESWTAGVAVGSFGVAWVDHYGGNLGRWGKMRLTTRAGGADRGVSGRYDTDDEDLDLVSDWSFAVFKTPAHITGVPSLTRHMVEPPRLWRIEGGRAVRLGVDATTLTPLDVDAGRILVKRSDGAIVVLARNGTALHTFPGIGRGAVRGFLDGATIVLDKAGLIELYGLDGTPGHRWQKPHDAMLEDATGELAVYYTENEDLRSTALHLVRLGDGNELVEKLPIPSDASTARLGPAGLFSSTAVAANHDGYATRCRLEFVSQHVLAAALDAARPARHTSSRS